MEIIEIFLIIFLITITAINIQIYKMIIRRYFDILRQLCNWESYIRKWVREELNQCHQQQD